MENWWRKIEEQDNNMTPTESAELVGNVNKSHFLGFQR
jgi:hypothetical protein